MRNRAENGKHFNLAAGDPKKLAMALFVCVAVANGVSVQVDAQAANPLTGGARQNYGTIKDFLTRAAEKMPAEHYAFRATPEVRTFAQLVSHIADANYRLCSILGGQNPPMNAGIEKSKTAKVDVTKALAESFAFCDAQYAAMTDAAGTAIVTFEAGGGEGSRVPISMPRLTVLAFQTQHAFEHYGNIITYMRLKGIVPPSSEPRRQQD